MSLGKGCSSPFSTLITPAYELGEYQATRQIFVGPASSYQKGLLKKRGYAREHVLIFFPPIRLTNLASSEVVLMVGAGHHGNLVSKVLLIRLVVAYPYGPPRMELMHHLKKLVERHALMMFSLSWGCVHLLARVSYATSSLLRGIDLASSANETNFRILYIPIDLVCTFGLRSERCSAPHRIKSALIWFLTG